MSPFRAGIGLLATRLRVPWCRMRMDGIFELKAAGKRWARPGQIEVSIGAPAQFARNRPARRDRARTRAPRRPLAKRRNAPDEDSGTFVTRRTAKRRD